MDETTASPAAQGGSELSSRHHQLDDNSAALLLADPPNNDPTVWERRRLLVVDLRIPMEKELDFVGELAEQHSRNYLMWQHRRWIVEKLGSEEATSNELEFTKKFLSKDSRISLAWSHRVWIIKRIGTRSGWESELQFCHDVLDKDTSNIFASDQRCRALRAINSNMTGELRNKEVSYARKAVEAQPWNEIAWTYLKCLHEKDPSSLYKDGSLESIYVDVLYKEACRVEAEVEREGFADPPPVHRMVVDRIVDKRGCLHSLNLVLDLMFIGYQGNNERLSHAVSVLLKHCRRYRSNEYGCSDIKLLEIVRNVCTLLLCLDAKRICFPDNYRGFNGFQFFRATYMNDSTQQDHQHIDKRAKRADTTRDPEEGSSLNSQSPPYETTVSMDDVRTRICRNSVFNNNNIMHPDNEKCRDLLLERLQIELEKRHHQPFEDHTINHLVWDLRQWAVKKVGDFDDGMEERKFTTTLIDGDAYNFHAWSHRKWVLETFYVGDYTGKIWEAELNYCAKVIGKDPFNSFAWDHRYFVVTRSLMEYNEARARGERDRAREANDYFWAKRIDEVGFAIKSIEDEPGNQCPWSHLRSLYALSGSMALDRRVSTAVSRVLEKGKACFKDPVGFEYKMEERGMINALNMLLDLLSYGYSSMLYKEDAGLRIVDAIADLSRDCPSDHTNMQRINAVLGRVEKDLTASGLVWKNAGSEFLRRGFSYFRNKSIFCARK